LNGNKRGRREKPAFFVMRAGLLIIFEFLHPDRKFRGWLPAIAAHSVAVFVAGIVDSAPPECPQFLQSDRSGGEIHKYGVYRAVVAIDAELFYKVTVACVVHNITIVCRRRVVM
jgi:hypothetical protein